MGDEAVQQQYEKWVYPEPIDDLSTTGAREAFDPSFKSVHLAYWPDRSDWQGSEILVAGCGANQAAQIAFHNRGCRVTGIDLSSASLAHEASLKRRHGLENLSLARMRLEEVGTLGRRFDLVLCVGVLHHLESPEAGLRALRECLDINGSMGLMVYGKYFRAGLYLMQDLFRRMGLEQTPADLEVVKQTLAVLPPHHPAASYLKAAAAVVNDSELVDTFLHRRDRAYSVDDCHELLERCGMKFQSWLPEHGHLYYPNAWLGVDHPLYLWTMGRPDREVSAAMELFSCSLGTHSFIACRDDRPAGSYRIELVPGNFTRLVPAWAGVEMQETGDGVTLKRPGLPGIALQGWQADFARDIDGVRSIGACAESSDAPRDEALVNFLESMRRLGYLLFRLHGH